MGGGVTRKLRMAQGVESLGGQGHLLRGPCSPQSRKGLQYSLTQGMKLALSFSFGDPSIAHHQQQVATVW